MCDGVPLDPIAAAEGTPLYVYSAATIAGRYRAIDDAFASLSPRDPLRAEGELDAGDRAPAARPRQQRRRELRRRDRRRAAAPVSLPSQIVFTGVGKTPAELGQAIDLGVRSINVESEGEIERIEALSRERKVRTKIAIRVNPDVDARTHPHISTGLKTNKFGIALDEVRALCARTRGRPNVEIVGLHAHVGSQITNLEPLTHAAAALVKLAGELALDGTTIEHLDIGGGLGVSYDGSPVPEAADYANAVLPVLRESGAVDRPGAGPARHRTGGRAAHARRGRQGAARQRPPVRGDGRGHDRADSADALQRVPSHRTGRPDATRR